MSGLKRPYFDDESEGVFTDIKATSVKRKLVSSPHCRTFTCDTLLNIASPVSASDDGPSYDDSNRPIEASPVHFLPSPSSGELLDVPSSTEIGGRYAASISTAEGSESKEDRGKSEICFGMVSYVHGPTSLGRW